MSVPITVRIPDDLAEFIDHETDNRTAFVVRALEHERRRLRYEQEIAHRLAAPDPTADAEEAAIVAATYRTKLDIE
ncbi:antitoxin [Nocardia terpenica]|uniref:Antitoxin n=1 Tax=Nocardia terpenica TaxID=455432 RepID=A0A291RDK0_9NOCA|nr:antitoxin [Nocardia terpenica]ATL65388.1 antitoxin [Nocardia terpenica]